ncbi:hypothetical protein, conserved [Leishmania tarentolae]|uniref:Transmembrane protein n=1 Tax=Leishmania tarentolae TaxID=5689 RepID=A0A640KKS2_LEITA|nr:hypothetical protein, conserved [Leishmania tarentolae]
MPSAEALGCRACTDIGGLNTDSGSRARADHSATSETDAAREGQRLRSEGPRENHAGGSACGDGGGDASLTVSEVCVDLSEVSPLTSVQCLPAECGTGDDSRSATVRVTDAAPLRDNEVFSAEHGREVPSDRLAANPIPLDVPLLISAEEQEPRNSLPNIPSVIVLRHRMGCSTVVLAPHQRAFYSRYDLENFVLYKEQKYNAVNVLWRFCVLILLVLGFSFMCLVLCVCTTEWLSVQNKDSFLSVGLFFSCHSRFLRICTSRQSAWVEWIVLDAVTGTTLCHASAEFVRRFIVAMWTMGILQLLCEVVALFLGLRIVARPTRSGALVLLLVDLLLSVCIGIVTVVLFEVYTSCLQRTCEGEHVSGDSCSTHHGYGYQLYIGAVFMHVLLLVLAVCMYSYIHSIRVTSRKQLRAERRRISRGHRAEDYIAHTLGSFTTSSITGDAAGGCSARSTWNGARTTSPLECHRPERQPSIVAAVPSNVTENVFGDAVAAPSNSRRCHDQDSGDNENVTGDALRSVNPTPLQLSVSARDTSPAGGTDFNVDSAYHGSGGGFDNTTVALPTRPARGPLMVQHGALHVFFAGVPDGVDDDGDSRPRSGNRSRLCRQHRSVSAPFFDVNGPRAAAGGAATAALSATNHNTDSSFVTRGRCVGAAVAVDGYNNQRQRRDPKHASPADSFLSRAGRQCSAGLQVESTEPSPAPKQKRGLSDKPHAAPAYQKARTLQQKFFRFFNREYDSNYLTAAELGVLIAGATDWVYDDRSDMYYSFDRNMFWDPLTQEYYNCALNSWQESPDQTVGVRDMLDYIPESLESSSNGSDSQFNGEHNEDSLVLIESPTGVAAGGENVNSSG